MIVKENNINLPRQVIEKFRQALPKGQPTRPQVEVEDLKGPFRAVETKKEKAVPRRGKPESDESAREGLC